MIKKFVIPGALSLFLLNSCSSDKTKSEALTEANKVHLESVAIHDSFEKEIDEKKRSAVAVGDSVLIFKLDSLHNLVELWEEGIIEVPDFEHEHHHEDGAHHHEHKSAPQMTDESMLDYQRNTKAAIEELQKDLNQLKD
ncbi:hypothetical protein L0657_18505 [Dyadobacter sp. CY345]|uniref:hypothetical protein n=1 Tax=Dyadobacter sp. CY345 TaxID=2909335 RepID=UPI001F1EA413|nr:hypothetical protein [Dyadobacter sp. CY345]MCF2445957.1 hypothetical protein [Dyadobacter sp. CY345]